jgi:dTDP-4-dehydrorhamnose 3,5-epimerase
MEVLTTGFAGLLVLKPQRHADSRGYFCETYSQRRLAEAGITATFVQENISLSLEAGTLRGLHFQMEPAAQAKLVSVIKGAARDVVVDLRRRSERFGQHFSIVLSEDEGNQLYVPAGFAHGFITLEPDTLFAYKVSSYYSPEHDAGIRFDDSTLGIDWGRSPVAVSDRDRTLPEFDETFAYFP